MSVKIINSVFGFILCIKSKISLFSRYYRYNLGNRNPLYVVILVLIPTILYCNPIVHKPDKTKQKLAAIDNKLYIISSINGGQFTEYSKTASIDDNIKITIVLYKSNGSRIIPYSFVYDFCDYGIKQAEIRFSPEIDSLIDKSMMNSSLNGLGHCTIKWYKVEEANGEHYSNTYPSWHWEKIPYKETEVIEWRNNFIVPADVTPTVFGPVYCNGDVVGTMRFKAILTINDESISTPGNESTYKGSINQDVHRISSKGNTNNEVINYGLAMCNLPYIWGSESFTGSKWDKHQAELFIGADCADFVVAAHQMAGKQLPYDSIKDLSYTKIIAVQCSEENGNYLDEQNSKIRIGNEGINIGDIIYWGEAHVGLLYADKSDPQGEYSGHADGIFNQWDLVLHTLFAEPKIESIQDIPKYGKLKVYRYKE